MFCQWVGIYKHAGAYRGQKRASDPLELEWLSHCSVERFKKCKKAWTTGVGESLLSGSREVGVDTCNGLPPPLLPGHADL